MEINVDSPWPCPYFKLPLTSGLAYPFYPVRGQLSGAIEQGQNLSFGRNTSPGFVALSPPLPCVVPTLGPGFVKALGDGQLQVEIIAASDIPGALSAEGDGDQRANVRGELTVSLGHDRNYHFPFLRQVGAAASPVFTAEVQGDDALARLQDLKTVVRKSQHIALCQANDVEATDRYTGLSDLTLIPAALPNLAWEELETAVSFLGRTFRWPFLITGMTGGLKEGAEINRRLARVATAFGIPMGVGSQRIAIENPEHTRIFAVKDRAPDLFLIGNLGICQLKSKDPLALCRQAIEMIDADALAIHVNVLQELIQVEGDRDFRGLLDTIAHVAQKLPRPVIVKEVGSGLDPASAQFLTRAGVAAIDCGGRGGTSWGYIEGLRAQSPATKAVADTFRDWGIPTGIAVAAIKQAVPEAEVIATGGIRDGLSAAKALALGAKLCGVGLPLLRAALTSEEAPMEVLTELTQGLKTAMLCTGAKKLSHLKERLHVGDSFLREQRKYTEPRGLASTGGAFRDRP